jgi:hypothetical protein
MLLTGRRVLAIDDIRNAFDNDFIPAVIEIHRRSLSRMKKRLDAEQREMTTALIEKVLRGYDQRDIGIDQGGEAAGPPPSPIAHQANLLQVLRQRRVPGGDCGRRPKRAGAGRSPAPAPRHDLKRKRWRL